MIRYQGVVYRVYRPKWAQDPTSGEGARLFGGRFNRVGVPALYAALEYETALEEFCQGQRPIKPHTTAALIVDCENILDLTQPAEQKALNVHQTHLDCPWAFMHAKGLEPPSWSLADKLVASGYAGMLVPAYVGAAKDKGTNLVLWKWGDAKPHLVEAHDPDGDLPTDLSSWK